VNSLESLIACQDVMTYAVASFLTVGTLLLLVIGGLISWGIFMSIRREFYDEE
jgi:hypothetical protein